MGWLSSFTDDVLGIDDSGGWTAPVVEAIDDAGDDVGNAVVWVADDVIGIDDSGGLGTSLVDPLTGKTAERGHRLEERSTALETEANALTSKADSMRDEYAMESFIYRNKGNFRLAMVSNELKYLKYTYPAESKELQERIDALKKDAAQYEKDYGSGFLGTKDWLGTWAGGIITNVAMLVGNVIGFILGRDGITFEDFAKSIVTLVILYFTWMYGPEMTAEVIGVLGVTVTYTSFYVTMTILAVISLDTMFGGSAAMIEFLNIFGQIFDGLGLNKGDNIFAKFFDSFKKDSEYNGYLIAAVQIILALCLMPSFDAFIGKELAMAMTVYSGVNAIDSTIKAREEYKQQKEEYEKNYAEMQEKAISAERNARLAKLDAAYREGDMLSDYTFFQQFASGKQWMNYRRDGLFYSTKDSPNDIMFQSDLMMILNPNPRTLGVA